MPNLLRALLLSFLAFSGAANAYANPLACTGLCGNSHDPAVIRRTVDGKYFRFSTGNRISVHTANSLSGPWVQKAAALPAGSKINKNGRYDLWAPDVAKVNNLYYLLYTVSSFGSQDSAVGYATSKDMESWTDMGPTGIASTAGSPYNAIDGNLVINEDRYYIAFGSFWSDIYVSSADISPTSGIMKATSNPPKQIVFTDVAPQAREGPSILKHGDFWYLFFSEGQCCGLDTKRPAAGKEYQIKVCRSKKPNSDFEDKNGTNCKLGGGTTVLASHGFVYAPGGQGAMVDDVEGPVLYYHYIDTRNGYADGQKLFGWNKLIFGSSGWPKV